MACESGETKRTVLSVQCSPNSETALLDGRFPDVAYLPSGDSKLRSVGGN